MKREAFTNLRTRLMAKSPDFMVVRKTPAALKALGPSNEGKILYWDEANGKIVLVCTIKSAADLAQNFDTYERYALDFLRKFQAQVIRPLSFGIKQSKEEWVEALFKEVAAKICKEVKDDHAFFTTMLPGDIVAWKKAKRTKDVKIKYFTHLPADVENKLSKNTRNTTSGLVHMLLDLTFPDNDGTSFVFEKKERKDGTVCLEIRGRCNGETKTVLRYNDITQI